MWRFFPFLELTENDRKKMTKKENKFLNQAVKNIQISWGPCVDEGL